MAPSAQAHHRSHSLLLLQKLLNLRDTASPLTLILDTLEQRATPLVQEFITRAKISKAKIILVSLATVGKPSNVDIFIKARRKSLHDLAIEIASHVAPAPPPTRPGSAAQQQQQPPQKFLIVIDALNPLIWTSDLHLLPTFFSSIIPPATTSLVAVYHTDVPCPSSPSPYSPPPLTLLSHIATAILTVSCLHHEAETKRALDRSQVPPGWGLNEGREGFFVGLRTNSDPRLKGGIVVEMELRRKSGRIVVEKFILMWAQQRQQQQQQKGQQKGEQKQQQKQLAQMMLMTDHPVFASPSSAEEEEKEEMEASFNLGLTEKQRRDREGVVLPYFDAQTEVGGGEGGRILYDIGSEDDFDEEEDEI
ncbi:Elongator complex protein 5 [Cladorrhinum sp. PSN332]|nr:Elongator complex protein 5 [Cladorrhinum sp. PSN332]